MVIDKKDAKEREVKVKSLLKRIGLEERMEHLPTQMSGGEQQRVTIARALVNEPLIILADEPTGELDTETTTNILKIFLDLKNAGESILMVTHNKRIAETADRIITLTDGVFTEEVIGGKTLEEINKF
jgi:putative ABC transport system ATP-binding protein